MTDTSGPMVPVRAQDLIPGQPLPHALYTRAGRLLAHRGTVATPDLCLFLAGHADAQFRFDTRAEPLSARSGAKARESPYSAPVPAESDRVVSERRLLRTRAELRRSAPALVQAARERWACLPLGIEVGVDPIPLLRLPRQAGDALPAADEEHLRLLRSSGIGRLRRVLAELIVGGSCPATALFEIAESLAFTLVHHPDLYALSALGLPHPSDDLPAHGFSTGAVALGIGARLGWPRADALRAAVAGFLADAGFALVPYPVRTSARHLSDIELNAVRRHPEYAVALARSVRALPEEVVLAVYQHQERGDGSGYPEAITADRTHDLARVVALADAFAGMTAPRAHRPALTPHAALGELARLAADGVFDSDSVRALIDLLGLFPVGSFVRLSSGHVALVGASAPPDAPDRPVVHVVQPSGSKERYGRAIDLRLIEPKLLRVTAAVPAPSGV